MKASRKSTSNGNQALIDAYFVAMIDEDEIESFVGICIWNIHNITKHLIDRA